MKRIRSLAGLCLAAALCLAVLSGCGREEEGQRLSVSVGSRPDCLDPIYTEDSGDQSILVQLYENLMRISTDANGGKTVVNGMAKSVGQTQRKDGTMVYTFKLRNGEWSDGEKVKADDFVYAWRRLADPNCNSPYAELLSVVTGYQEARNTGDMSKLQVSAPNESTFVVTLDGQYDWFLTEVCTSPATMPLRQDVIQQLKKQNQESPWWSDPTALVTNGAYVAAKWEPDSELLVRRSPGYETNHVGPSEICFRFAENAEAAWELYQSGEVDMVWPLTEEELEKRSQNDTWGPTPTLSTYSILMNYHQEQLSDPLVRQAMSLVLDRTKLAGLLGQTALPAEGLVPPGVPQNEQGDFRTVGGPLCDNRSESYQQNCELARALLDESGHEMGLGLGQLEYLYAEEEGAAAVAEALCRMWQDTLHVSVTPRGVTEEELWTAVRKGEYQLVGLDVTAPGNDAECFLMQWTSDSHDNLVGYENSAYDTLMNIIATANSEMARMGCLHDAEALLLSDNVVVPLCTKGTDWQMREEYTGLLRDPRGWFSFVEVFSQNG